MGILGNMKGLSFLSRVETSHGYQNRYFECGGSQRYHYGMCAMLELISVVPKFRLRRVQKKGKRAKSKKLCFAKKNFFFLRVHKVEIVRGVNTVQKNRGEDLLNKKVFEFLAPIKVHHFGNFVIFTLPKPFFRRFFLLQRFSHL